MLKRKDIPEALIQPAAEVRVTPEELAAAIGVLQVRTENMVETILIGNAIEELFLNFSSEDVLREVEVSREYAHNRLNAIAKKRKWAISLSISLLCLLGFGFYSEINNSSSDTSQMAAGTIPYNLEAHILAFDPKSSKPAISTLAEAPDGKTVYCSPDALERAAMSRNAQEEPQRQISQLPAELIWPVAKYGKGIYVRGWIRTPLSKEAAKLVDMAIFNSPNSPELGPNPQQVTMKLDMHTSLMGLSYKKLPDGTSEFVSHYPRLTALTYEKWQP